MNTLVTGGTGFVGGAIVRELLARRHAVRVLARRTSATAPLETAGAAIARGDILDRDSLVRALQGRDTLFHAAAIYDTWIPDQELLFQTEVQGTRNVLEAALAAGVERVVYTSTALSIGERRGETGTEQTPHRGYFLTAYEESKFRAEQLVRTYSGRLKVAILNPAAVLGPGDRKPTGQAIIHVLNGKLPALFDGVLTYVHVDDVARGHVLAAEQERWGERFILAARALTNRELFGIVCRLGGVRKPPTLPGFLVGLFADVQEWRSRRSGGRPLLARGSFDIARHGFRADGSRAARELGLVYTPIEESLRAAVQWYWEQGLLTRKPACSA